MSLEIERIRNCVETAYTEYKKATQSELIYCSPFRLGPAMVACRKIQDSLQAALDAVRAQPESWNGEGLPPVGVECEAITEYGYLPCRVVDHGDGYAVLHFHPNEHNLKVDWTRHGCRPIRTQEQREVEELARLLDVTAGDTMEEIATALIAAGWRKPE